MAADGWYQTWWQRYTRMAASPGAALAILQMWARMDVTDILSTVQVPTLILNRRDDRLTPPGMATYLSEHIKGASHVELSGVDSALWAGDVDAVVEEVEEFLTGARHDPDTDRMLATVVFTDIVESTHLAASMGDRLWRELLDRHDLMVTKQVERFRGRKVKTTGDGVLATFDGPARAIRCACAIRDGATGVG